jgi:peroxiredoxin
MIELGQLARHSEDFARRNARVIVISMEGTEDAAKTQEQFPHLLVLSDHDHGLSKAAGLVHEHASPDGSDADMPTTILVDGHGVVRWIYRSPEVIARLSPEEVLQALDQNIP